MPLGSLNQKAAYWNVDSYDGWAEPILADTPIEIDCRWEDAHELFIDATGEEQTSQAIVYVDRDLILGGMLWLGELSDGPPADPQEDETNKAFEIRKVEDVPNTDADNFLKRVML